MSSLHWPQWAAELGAAIHDPRPTLEWLPPHLVRLIPEDHAVTHLLNIVSDLCDLGHVHLDILIWVLTETALHSLIVSEEHYDNGPEIATTFEVSVSSHPLDTIEGTAISTVHQPDGNQLDVTLAVMLNTPGHTGQAEGMSFDDGPTSAYQMVLQPASLSFSAPAERTGELSNFARELLQLRELTMRPHGQ